jgi:hypothetical protein
MGMNCDHDLGQGLCKTQLRHSQGRRFDSCQGLTCSCIFRSCSWLDLINVYKFPLNNFHLQDSSTIVQPTEIRCEQIKEISLFHFNT